MQTRLEEERKRLSSLKVPADHPSVQEVVQISGQALGNVHKVAMEDLLRKPRINHG